MQFASYFSNPRTVSEKTQTLEHRKKHTSLNHVSQKIHNQKQTCDLHPAATKFPLVPPRQKLKTSCEEPALMQETYNLTFQSSTLQHHITCTHKKIKIKEEKRNKKNLPAEMCVCPKL